MSDLPKEYDVVIVGTGLTESILAAALSRIGKSVLHIDRNQNYGGEFSSNSLTSLFTWAANLKEKPANVGESQTTTTDTKTDDDAFESVECNNDMGKYYFDIEHKFNEKVREDLMKKSRYFVLDLSPNIFYSSGELINLLISSDVARYCEFKMVSQILTRRQNGTLEKVPTSRSEVFKSSQLGMIEKRVMMQFVQSCLKDNNFADFALPDNNDNLSFRQLIEAKKLPETISHYLINAVAMCADENRSALEGLQMTKKFLKSVGRYGDSPFLYCMYGSGELSQCFCRMAAVFGALYYLTLTIEKFYVNKSTNLVESIDGLTLQERFKFNCKHLVLDTSYAPSKYLEKFDKSNRISRCILITDKSIYNKNQPDSKDEHVSLLFMPKTEKSPEIYLFECSHTVNCSPKEYFVVYMFAVQKNSTAKEDFKESIEILFRNQENEDERSQTNEESDTKEEEDQSKESKETSSQSESESDKRPNILFSFYFSHLNSNEFVEKHLPENMPSNLHIVSGSSANIDFEHQVHEAEKIFRRICPSDEFLPRPPDPEDIIIETTPMSDLDDSGAKEDEAKFEADAAKLEADEKTSNNDSGTTEPEAKEPKLEEKTDQTN